MCGYMHAYLRIKRLKEKRESGSVVVVVVVVIVSRRKAASATNSFNDSLMEIQRLHREKGIGREREREGRH